MVLLSGFPLLSETIYTPALPNIAGSLKTSMRLTEWTLSIYFLGFAAGVLLWGGLSDKYGRRKIMLFGIMIYILSSFICFLSPSINALLAARFFQALGASVGSVITQTMVRDVFSGTRRNQIYSLVMMALAIAPALGPFFGGLLVHFWNWRANFSFLVILGFLIFFYSLLRLPETHPNLHSQGKINLSRHLLTVAKRLLIDKHIWLSAALVGGFNGLIFSFYSEGPFIIIELLNFTPYQYGLLGTIFALCSAMGGLSSHYLNEELGATRLIAFGILGTFISSLLLLVCFCLYDWHGSAYVSLTIIVLCLSGIYFSFSLTVPNVLSLALDSYKNELGMAGSLFGCLYYLFISLFTFLMGVLHNGTIFALPYYFVALSLMLFILQMVNINLKDDQ